MKPAGRIVPMIFHMIRSDLAEIAVVATMYANWRPGLLARIPSLNRNIDCQLEAKINTPPFLASRKTKSHMDA